MPSVRRFIDPRMGPAQRVVSVWAAVVATLVLFACGSADEWGAGIFAAIAVALAVGLPAFHLLTAQAAAAQEARDLWGLTGVMIDGRPWPPPGQWALSASALTALIPQIRSRGLKTIVELGPGTSSVVLAHAGLDAQMFGLEHDERFVRSLTALFALHGMTDYHLIHAPLDGRWYDPHALDRLPSHIDVLIVDGPPNWRGTGNRAPAWPTLKGRMSSGGLVLVDDTARADERRMVRRWTEDGLRVFQDRGEFVVLEVL